MSVNKTNPQWRAQTQLVRGGTHRSQFAETNEAIFMTSGYVYETAEQAQRAFKGEEERFIYSRFSNPTVGMFEERMRLLEGATSCRATATGAPEGGQQARGVPRTIWFLPRGMFRIPAQIWRRDCFGGRHQSGGMGGCLVETGTGGVFGNTL